MDTLTFLSALEILALFLPWPICCKLARACKAYRPLRRQENILRGAYREFLDSKRLLIWKERFSHVSDAMEPIMLDHPRFEEFIKGFPEDFFNLKLVKRMNPDVLERTSLSFDVHLFFHPSKPNVNDIGMQTRRKFLADDKTELVVPMVLRVEKKPIDTSKYDTCTGKPYWLRAKFEEIPAVFSLKKEYASLKTISSMVDYVGELRVVIACE